MPHSPVLSFQSREDQFEPDPGSVQRLDAAVRQHDADAGRREEQAAVPHPLVSNNSYRHSSGCRVLCDPVGLINTIQGKKKHVTSKDLDESLKCICE